MYLTRAKKSGMWHTSGVESWNWVHVVTLGLMVSAGMWGMFTWRRAPGKDRDKDTGADRPFSARSEIKNAGAGSSTAWRRNATPKTKEAREYSKDSRFSLKDLSLPAEMPALKEKKCSGMQVALSPGGRFETSANPKLELLVALQKLEDCIPCAPPNTSSAKGSAEIAVLKDCSASPEVSEPEFESEEKAGPLSRSGSSRLATLFRGVKNGVIATGSLVIKSAQTSMVRFLIVGIGSALYEEISVAGSMAGSIAT